LIVKLYFIRGWKQARLCHLPRVPLACRFFILIVLSPLSLSLPHCLSLFSSQEDVNRDHLFNVSGDPANTQSADQRARLLNATDRESKNTKLLDDARRQLVWFYGWTTVGGCACQCVRSAFACSQRGLWTAVVCKEAAVNIPSALLASIEKHDEWSMRDSGENIFHWLDKLCMI
jgi:hypothetical protein